VGLHSTAHDLSLVKTREVLELVQQLSTSHSEAARIISRTEGKLDDIGGITRQTQNALHQLADRVVHRDTMATTRDEQITQRLIDALESTLREQLADHFRSLSVASSLASDPTPPKNTKQFHKNSGLHFNESIGLGERSNSLRNRNKTDSSTTVHQANPIFSGPLWLDFEDEIGSGEQPHVERMSKYRSVFGEVRMRTASTTYSSLVALMEADVNVAFIPHWKQPEHFPVTVTTTEILLLPRNWSKSKLAVIKWWTLARPILNAHNILLDRHISGGWTGSTIPSVSIPSTLAHHVRGAFRKSKVTFRNVISRTMPSILDVAFETALLAINSKKAGNAVVRFLPAMPKQAISRQNQHLRKSFDDEINDAIEIVHLWLSSGFNVDFCGDTIPEGAISTMELSQALIPIDCDRNRAFHEFRLWYAAQLIIEMVNRSSSSCCNLGASLDPIHELYWADMVHAVFGNLISVAVQIYPIETHVEQDHVEQRYWWLRISAFARLVGAVFSFCTNPPTTPQRLVYFGISSRGPFGGTSIYHFRAGLRQ
jgi:hypothetical protein